MSHALPSSAKRPRRGARNRRERKASVKADKKSDPSTRKVERDCKSYRREIERLGTRALKAFVILQEQTGTFKRPILPIDPHRVLPHPRT